MFVVRKGNGFSLLEMLVVLVIMGLLAGLVGPRLFDRADKAKVQATEYQIETIVGALLTMRLDIGRFPTTEEGLAVLNRKPDDTDLSEHWQGPYLAGALPRDPWDRSYLYSLTPSEFQPFSLYSFGADGQPGGEGINEDIGFKPVN